MFNKKSLSMARLLTKVLNSVDEMSAAKDCRGSGLEAYDDFREEMITWIQKIADDYGCVAGPDEDGNPFVATEDEFNAYRRWVKHMDEKDIKATGYGDWILARLLSCVKEPLMISTPDLIMELAHDLIAWHIKSDEINSWIKYNGSEDMVIACYSNENTNNRDMFDIFVEYIRTAENLDIDDVLKACATLIKDRYNQDEIKAFFAS